MVKKIKSKNAIIKKAKKLERQGKYKKALKVCDDFLDDELDLNILEIKMDLINNMYFSEEFLEKINSYQNTLTNFLSKYEEENLLKLYSATKNKMDFYTQSADNSYLIGGLILDNLESLLILNVLTEKNNNNDKDDVDNLTSSKIPEDLKIFKKDIELTAKQYLSLNSANIKDILSNENANINKAKTEIKELAKFIANNNEGHILEDDKTLEESKIDEKTIKKLSNKIEQNINEKKYEEALEFVNEALITDSTNINILEYKVRILNHMQRFEEALSSQKTLVQIAKNLEMNLSKNEEKSSDEKNQKTLFEF